MQTSAKPLPSSYTLSAEDVASLLEDRSAATLLTVTSKIAGTYSHSPMKPADAQAAEQIFRLLLRDTETSVRAALSENVKQSKTLPRDIAMTMARDVEEVALPLLEHSEALTEEDLLELVETTDSPTRQLALSRRDHVPEKLSDALLAKGNDEVANTLVNNIGAELSEKGMTSIVERFPENKPLMSALVSRPLLSAAVAEKLISHVSASLAKTLKDKYKLPDKEIEQEVEKTREGETLKLVRATHDQGEIDKLVHQLQSFHRLTPTIILSALCQGNFAFFETALARLSGIAVSNARALISDRGDLGFRAIYNKSGLPETMFPAVRNLLRSARSLDAEGDKPGTPGYANRLVERLLSQSQSAPAENTAYIIALIRRVI